jgi:hypothetical protein
VTINEVMRKARYGHRDWIVWNDKSGDMQARRASRETIKEALLSIGTAGRWFIVGASTGVMHRYRFSDGCRMMRNAKHIWGRL